MGKRTITRKQTLVILAIIVALQCGAMFYWGGQKSSYYLDELFTFEYVQNISNETDSKEYMNDNPSWRDEEWLSVGELKKRYIVEEGESVFDLPFSTSVKKLFFDKNYMWIINALETAFGNGSPPKWICICFNVFVWFIFQFLLFFFFDSCLKFDRRTSMLAVTMWGFCPLVMGLSAFCRFYSWTLLLFLILIVSHRKMWDCDSNGKFIGYEVIALFVTWLAFKNSDLMFVLCGALAFLFTLGLIIRKKYIQAVCYSVPFSFGGLFLAWKKTSLLNVIFHPILYATYRHGVTARMADFFLNASWQEKMYSFAHSVKSFAESVMGSVEFALLAILLLLALYWTVRKTIRHRIDGYALILLGVSFVFWIFCGLCGLNETRYYSFFFLLLFIVGWMLFDTFAAGHHASEMVFKVALCIVLAGAVIPFYRRNVQYIYESLKPSIEKISENGDLKSIVNYDPVHNFNAYYSTTLLNESASIYPVREYLSTRTLPELPDRFLYWSTYYWSPEEVMELIKEEGYTADLLFEAGLSMVYLCQKDEGVED